MNVVQKLKLILKISGLTQDRLAQKKKRFYYLYLNKSQTENKFDLLTDYICDAILDGYQIIEK